MGHTGAPRDMLHFEIRRNGKPVESAGAAAPPLNLPSASR
jgi:murein DD-endopeptidase MepM/ murein hydrolase activator NlpD